MTSCTGNGRGEVKIGIPFAIFTGLEGKPTKLMEIDDPNEVSDGDPDWA